jgi:hypothetical protein
VVSAGCGGEAVEEPRTFADYLHVGAERCGFGSPDALGGVPAGSLPEQVGAIAAAVEELRGLDRAEELEPRFVRAAELERRLRELTERELTDEDVERVEAAGTLLAAFPPGFEADTIVDAVVADTAGFYDPDAEEIFIERSAEGRLDELEVSIVAHELEHALVDDAFGLGEGDPRDGWGDSLLAESALGEGSATLTELRFDESLLDRATFRSLLATPVGPAALVSTDLPYVLAFSFVFPYVEGLGFVCELYARGGWDAVDAAYRRPPTTSAEILFPERYLDGERPGQPPPLGRLPAPWRLDQEADGVFGAADLLALFQAPGDDLGQALDRPLRRASAWDGGRVELWRRGSSDAAIAVALVQRPDTPSLCVSLGTWYERARPEAEKRLDGAMTTFTEEDRAAVVSCRGSDVRFAVAPTAGEARRLLSG